LGDFPHGADFFTAHLAVAQVRLDIPLSRRFQGTRQVLLEALDHYPVHTFLPLQV
jgi:hypothetical protein